MRIGLTGAYGFLGWHLRCASLVRGVEVLPVSREMLGDSKAVAESIASLDAIVHLAGVNRADAMDDVYEGNLNVARQLATGIARTNHPVTVIFGNSVQSLGASAFGQAKAESAQILSEACSGVGGTFVDVLLPNIFGEHGKPFYNSVVATFSHQLAIGETPRIIEDRELPLMHAQAAANKLLDLAHAKETQRVMPSGRPTAVSEILARLTHLNEQYQNGLLPDFSDTFTRDLFNSYRSYLDPSRWGISTVIHSDARGQLFETVKSLGGEAQVFVSTTAPEAVRGQHFHVHKFERFVVLQGRGRIQMRRLFTDEVFTFEVDGSQPTLVDMPTLWTHSIRNTGTTDLLTLFYADQLYDSANADTYPMEV